MDAPDDIRIRLTVHYDGSDFHGWQVQPEVRTVQGVLESILTRLADRSTGIIGSGRTDTGVHATGQVFAVDMPSTWTSQALRQSLNSLLPDDVWIESALEASRDFHPRYDALRRSYRYEVGMKPAAASPFHRRWCWPMDDELDVTLLRRAAEPVPGERSFRAFAKAGQPERGERCHVHRAAWSETSLGMRLTITADRYLHHMVRYLTGTMVDIARGRRPLDDMARLLDNEPDVVTSPPAPPTGLFLHEIEYPHDPHR